MGWADGSGQGVEADGSGPAGRERLAGNGEHQLNWQELKGIFAPLNYPNLLLLQYNNLEIKK